jgi:type IV pilus assembly protein PilF
MKDEERAKIEPEFNHALEIWRDGDGRAAIFILERLASEYPNRPAILGVLGAIYSGLGEHERAVDYFQQTLSLSPKSELASRALFFSLCDIGRYGDAMSEMERYLSIAQSKEYDLLIQETLEELEK